MTAPFPPAPAPIPFKERAARSPWLVGWLFVAAGVVVGTIQAAVTLPALMESMRSFPYGGGSAAVRANSVATSAMSGLSGMLSLALTIGQIVVLVKIWQRASSRGDNVARRNVAGRVNLWLTSIVASIVTIPIMFFAVFFLIGTMVSRYGDGRSVRPDTFTTPLILFGAFGLLLSVFGLLVLIATIVCTVAEWRGEAKRPFCAIPFWRPRDLVPYHGYGAPMPPTAPPPGQTYP